MTKEDLLGYRGMKHDIAQCIRMQKEMLLDIAGPKAVTLDGMPKGSRKEQDLMAASIARHMERVEEYAQRVTVYTDRCRQIEDAVEHLPQQERKIMRARYLLGKERPTWAQVAYSEHYAERTVMEYHRRALEFLETIDLK